MAPKSTKKPATKKVVAKKTVSKPAAVKKAPVKPVVEHASCDCAGKCHCHKHCNRGKMKQFVGVLVFFALGFIAATVLLPQPAKKHIRMPKPEFENGCLVVNCPKLAEMVPAMDTNADNCVSIEEFKAYKKAHRPDHRGEAPIKPAPEQVTE